MGPNLVVGDISIPLILQSQVCEAIYYQGINALGDLEYSASQWNNLEDLCCKGSLSKVISGKSIDTTFHIISF